MFPKSMFISFCLGWSLLSCGIAQALPKPITPPNLVAQSYNEKEPSASAFGFIKIKGAVVRSDVTLARSLGAISSSVFGEGLYEVVFP